MITCGLPFHSFKEGIKKKRNPGEQRLKNTPAEDAKQATTKTAILRKSQRPAV